MTDYNFQFNSAQDLLASIRLLVRLSRQGANLTQGELASKAGVPATTISRLERTGLASTDALARILFALNELEGVEAAFDGRIRQWKTLLGGQKTRLRVHHSKEEA